MSRAPAGAAGAPRVATAPSWLERTGPWAGIGTSPAAMMVGGGVAERLTGPGLVAAGAAGVAGLTALAVAQGAIGRRARMETMGVVSGPLGRLGARRVASPALLLMMIGWFGLNAGVAGLATARLLGIGEPLGVILFSLVMLAIVRLGLSTLSWTALAAGVATIVLAAYGLALALGDETSAAPPDAAGGGLAVVGGVTLVIGFGAAFALRTPDFTHDLARPRHVVWCALTGLSAPLAAFFAAGVALQRTTGEWNLADVLLELDSATVAYLFLMIGFSGSVLTNLYSGALALRQTVGGVGPDRALLVVALAGGALAVAGLADHMLRYLAVMALAASGLIVLSVLHRARGLAIRDGWRLPGLAAWTLGFLLGLPLEAAGSPLALPIALLATGITDLLMSSARRTLSGSETDMGDE